MKAAARETASALPRNFVENGYAIIDTNAFDLSIPALSRGLAEWLASCEFGNLKLNKKFETLAELVSHVHDGETDNAVTARIYQVLPTVPLVYEFLAQSSLLETLNAYGIVKPSLGTVPLIRIDRPGDTKYATPWHQDKWFSLSSDHSVVMWAPMGELDASMGYLQIIPGSHKQGIVDFKKRETGREPYEPVIPPDESKSVPVAMKYGEMIVFHQDLLHRSNINQSPRCRVSLQLRFNDMFRQPFPHTTFTANHSEHVLTRQAGFLKNAG